jgi:hypothetical protein
MSDKPNGSIPADIAAESAQAPQPLNLMRYDAARAALAEAHRVDASTIRPWRCKPMRAKPRIPN